MKKYKDFILEGKYMFDDLKIAFEHLIFAMIEDFNKETNFSIRKEVKKKDLKFEHNEIVTNFIKGDDLLSVDIDTNRLSIDSREGDTNEQIEHALDYVKCLQVFEDVKSKYQKEFNLKLNNCHTDGNNNNMMRVVLYISFEDFLNSDKIEKIFDLAKSRKSIDKYKL